MGSLRFVFEDYAVDTVSTSRGRIITETDIAAPVFIGDTIHVSQRVAETQKKNAERGVVAFEITVLKQDGTPV